MRDASGRISGCRAKKTQERIKMDYKEFIAIAEQSFPEISGKQKERFKAMEGLYREWNEKINVISRKDIGNLYPHHVLHSLCIARFISVRLPDVFSAFTESPAAGRPAIKVLDIGTGGGFPGIPLAILFPEVQFTLCDSVGKKTIVASEVSKSLGLENVTVVNDRAENLHGRYDYIVSRAVTSLDKFMPWAKGKYSKGIFYLKGGDVVEEIALTMGKYRMPKGSIHTWPADSWLRDGYFSEKLVIFIENICN